MSTLKPTDIEVTIPQENMYGSSLGIGEKMWLPFTIQIPPDVVTPMEVSTKNQMPYYVNAFMIFCWSWPFYQEAAKHKAAFC